MATHYTAEGLPIPSEAHNEGMRWLIAHIHELAERYPNQWVAVHRDRVLAADADLSQALDAAEKLADADDIVAHFVDDGTVIL